MLGTANRDRTAERREATRREILDAAWQVAREQGLAQLTLREVAARVGMRAPSLYSHFDSKNAIYSAMFGEAWTELNAAFRASDPTDPTDPPEPAALVRPTGHPGPDRDLRAALQRWSRLFFDFSVADLTRHQLMNQRTLPDFEPAPEDYAPAVEALETLRGRLAGYGVTRGEDVDLYTALLGGLVDAQLANDPGGDRWSRLLERTIDMYADHLESDLGKDLS